MTEVGAVSFNVNNGKIEGLADNQEQAPCQAINLAVHNAMLWHMLALRKGPFFFKEDIYRRDVAFDPLSMPVYGLLQNAKLTQDGFCQLVADLGLGKNHYEMGQCPPTKSYDLTKNYTLHVMNRMEETRIWQKR